LTPDLILKAYQESAKYLQRNNSQKSLAGYGEIIRPFIIQISNNDDFPFLLVKKAVDLFGISDESKILEYCIQHENDGLFESEDEGKGDVVMYLNATNFIQSFQNTWIDFMKGQSNFLTNYISIEQLAYILDQLKHEEIHHKKTYKRNIPGYLTHKGKPNLILCPAADQISTVLSIYSESGFPLPSNDECLFCTNETSGEEVEILLRVALKSDGNKIYTLLNI
jgi:hypothetical protein